MEANADRETVIEETTVEDRKNKGFWYEDGNVILVAGNVEFRVFKGILADHSPVFKDMFALPQPDTAPSDNAVCPVVDLTDSPSDLRHILRLIMPKAKANPFKYNEDKWPPFEAVLASIRLGHKYQMSTLVEHTFDYLKDYFPTVFDVWDKCSSYAPPSFITSRAIAVVNLARTYDKPTLLPSALLVCTTLKANTLVTGFQRDDGGWEKLSDDDLARCVQARSAFVTTSIGAAIRVFNPRTAMGCKRQAQCEAELRKMLEGLDGVLKRFAEPCDPTRSYVKLYKDVGQRLCWACHDMVRVREVKERRAAWVALPDLLDIKVKEWETK
ncbi:hypothetical protein V8D89_008997 [Ganoderma adspersum]